MQVHEPYAAPARKGPPRPQDAVTPIPATANSYEVTSEDDVGDLLTILAASGEAISMYAAGSEVVLGRILSVDPEFPHFVIELNAGSTLTPGKVTFVAPLPTAKLQFQLAKPEWDCVPGQPHLIPLTFPETCAVLNRRSSERVETPLSANFIASFAMGTSDYELSIYDFSLGGIGLRCAKGTTRGMIKGRKLKDVELDFGSETVTVAELEIRFTRNYRSFLAGEQVHLGCMFTNLAPEEESKIQRVLQAHHAPSR